MLFYVLWLLFGIIAAQKRQLFCSPAKPPLPLPPCTRTCLTGENKILDGTCADNLVGMCHLSNTVHIHFDMFGQCLLDACPSTTDRQEYVDQFKKACEGTNEDYFTSDKYLNYDEFDYQELLMGTPSVSFATSTDDSTSTYTTTVKYFTTTTLPPSTSHSSSTFSSSSETEKPSDAPSSAPPPPPPPQPAASKPAAASSSTDEGKPTSAVAAPPPSNTSPKNDITLHSHDHTTTSSSTAQESTGTHAPEPALSTTAIAGTAAGGTIAIALIIGLILFFLRRRKRRASLASSADIWEPSRNTSPKPKLPVIENDSSFGRYSEVGAGAPMRQRLKAELHSESAPPLPRPQTAYNSYPSPPEIRGGGGSESAPYYRSAQQSQLHHHGSNIDSRYPEMGSHATTSIPSPNSPISASSTMQGWRANSPSGVPTIRMSSADVRSEGMRSPVSELGTNTPLRSTRSAELHGAEITSPISELGADSFHGDENRASELHTDPVLPPKLAPGGRGDMTAVIAEMEGGSNMRKGHQHGVSTNF